VGSEENSKKSEKFNFMSPKQFYNNKYDPDAIAAVLHLVNHGEQWPQWTQRPHNVGVRGTRSGGCLHSQLTEGRQAITSRGGGMACSYQFYFSTRSSSLYCSELPDPLQAF